MTNEILEWSAGKIASQINTGAVTATEVVQTFINQIESRLILSLMLFVHLMKMLLMKQRQSMPGGKLVTLLEIWRGFLFW